MKKIFNKSFEFSFEMTILQLTKFSKLIKKVNNYYVLYFTLANFHARFWLISNYKLNARRKETKLGQRKIVNRRKSLRSRIFGCEFWKIVGIVPDPLQLTACACGPVTRIKGNERRIGKQRCPLASDVASTRNLEFRKPARQCVISRVSKRY